MIASSIPSDSRLAVRRATAHRHPDVAVTPGDLADDLAAAWHGVTVADANGASLIRTLAPEALEGLMSASDRWGVHIARES